MQRVCVCVCVNSASFCMDACDVFDVEIPVLFFVGFILILIDFVAVAGDDSTNREG